jgi:hypothetical protein
LEGGGAHEADCGPGATPCCPRCSSVPPVGELIRWWTCPRRIRWPVADNLLCLPRKDRGSRGPRVSRERRLILDTPRLGSLRESSIPPLSQLAWPPPLEAVAIRPRCLPAHLRLNYWISARPLLVRRTSSPMTVMFSSRPTIRLVLPGIAPPA